jgi:hypothetical protein
MWVKYHVQMVQGVGEGCFLRKQTMVKREHPYRTHPNAAHFIDAKEL